MNTGGILFLRIDGIAADPASAAVSAADRGLAYGDGVFRTLRLTGGRVPAWTRHASKLRADCARLALPMPDVSMIERDLADLGSLHPECTARITVTAGVSARGYRRNRDAVPTTLVQASAATAPAGQFDLDGVPVHLCYTRLAGQPALAGVKHLNRLEQVLARAEWDDPAVPEGLMLDMEGNVTCGTMSNVFIVESERIATPALELCGVAGVQRERVLDWAARSGIEVAIEVIAPARLLAADSVLLSNSVIGTWWVNRLSGNRFVMPHWHPVLQAALAHDE